MPLAIQCPNLACNATFNVADAISGRNVKCKKCGTPFKAVPTQDGDPADAKRPAATDPFPALPAAFGRYRVLKKLGQGGMGAVYLAEDTHLGRPVALKLPTFDAGAAPTRVERFVREARSSAVLQHPNICTVFDAGEIGGRPFISMAYIDGKPLEDLIDPDAPLPQERAAGLARKIARGLAHAHAQGIVHRDLKPANVMLTAGGEPVVMDFGLAKRVADIDPDEAKLTKAGAVMGTPSYMAPEQVNGEAARVGPATDVYALGVMLFEMLAGRTPYGGPIGAVMAQILTAPVPALRAVRPDADPRLEALCQEAMAKDPAGRPATMAAFAARLDDYFQNRAAAALTATAVVPPPPPANPFDTLHGSGSDESLPEAPRRRRRARPPRWALAAGAAAVGLLLIAAAVALTTRAKHGDVVIELSDPAAQVEVKLDEKVIDRGDVGRAVPVAPGDHRLTVTGSDIEPASQSFTVKTGDRQTVTVNLKSRAQRPKPPPAPPKATADFTGPGGGEEREFEIFEGVKMRFCRIPAGKTTLGSPSTERHRSDREPLRPFETAGFWLGKYEVTQQEWLAVTGTSPSHHKGPTLPVDNVSWDDCQKFLAKCRAPGWAVKLPHDDEWEYACRGGKGNMQPFYWGGVLNGEQANINGHYPYNTSTQGPYLYRTTPVGTFETVVPHPWGLCDMAGNVFEWCDNLYKPGEPVRVLRGGCWWFTPEWARSAARELYAPAVVYKFVGFRVALVPPK